MRRWFHHMTLRAWRRSQLKIIAEYDRQWGKKGWEKYRPRRLHNDGAPWLWSGQRMLLSNEAGAYVRIVYLEAALASLRPSSVLEIGCGNGVNLLLLAGRFPETRFCGLEPTPNGVAMAASVVAAGRLPDALLDFAPFALVDDNSVSRIEIVKGTGAALPFRDAQFDVVFTSLALEQMEAVRQDVLHEIGRVSAKYVVMLEPFTELNGRGLRRRYVKAYDYFQGAIADLPRYGIEPVNIVTDMPHKAWLGTALVIARKSGT